MVLIARNYGGTPGRGGAELNKLQVPKLEVEIMTPVADASLCLTHSVALIGQVAASRLDDHDEFRNGPFQVSPGPD